MIELATRRDFEMPDCVLRHVLHGLDPKTPAVTRTLIAIGDDPFLALQEAAADALTIGINPKCRSLVAGFFVRYLAIPGKHERSILPAIRVLQDLGGIEHVAALTAILENPKTGDGIRNRLRALLEHIKSRVAEPVPDDNK